MSSEGERAWWCRQALASTRIEGHVPAPEFLADCAAYVAGEISSEDARARSLTRAMQEHAQLMRAQQALPSA